MSKPYSFLHEGRFLVVFFILAIDLLNFLLPLISLAGEHHDLDLNLGIAPPHRANGQTQDMEMASYQVHYGSNNLSENRAQVHWTFRYLFLLP